MNRSAFCFLMAFLAFVSLSFSQQFTQVTPLSSILGESSGLLFQNGKIITHTDSQGEAALYEVDSLTGDPTRKVVIANASNTDWEDITADSNYFYIGDFGNNNGNRTNLRIYRVSQNEYWNTPNDTIFADTINFSFADQTNFTAMPELSNYDCEAIAAIGDSLYLFTKNWVNAKTNVYRLPKTPGTYAAPKIDSIFVQGLITGADYHPPSNRLILCGYTQYPFVVEMNNPLGGSFHQNSFVRYNLPNTALIQLEAVAAFSDNNYYLTAETFQGISVRLYRLTGTKGVASLTENQNVKPLLFPNPTNGTFSLELLNSKGEIKLDLYDVDGRILPISFDKKGEIFRLEDDLPIGVYFLHVRLDERVFVERVVVE